MKVNKYLVGFCSALLLFGTSASAETVADAAADYVAAAGGDTATLTTLPDGWSYFHADAANGGVEVALLPNAVGNQGIDYQGFQGGGGFGTAAVYGTNTAAAVTPDAEFQIFSNGNGNNNGEGGNFAVVGEDLLLHPGNQEVSAFLIVRYTIADASAFLAGTGAISGNFRELALGNNLNDNNGGSVDVSVYQNGTQLFLFDNVEQDATVGGQTSQADGTFNLTGLTFATGDTIDFVVGNNGNFGADETVLQALIEVDTDSTAVILGDADLNGEVNFLDIAPFIQILSSNGFLDQADIDRDGEVTFLDIQPFIDILAS